MPYASKPFFSAVSCAEPGAGEPSGMVNCEFCGGEPGAGPGGNSSGPSRPQPDRLSAATSAKAGNRNEKTTNRIRAKTRVPKGFQA